MYIVISIALAIAYAWIKPLADGLINTSQWISKTFTPKEVEGTELLKQSILYGQAAIMEGWLSNIPLIESLLFSAAVVFAFFFHWWFAIVMFLVSVFLGAFAKALWTKPVAHYILIITNKMINRAADYKKAEDFARAEAAENYCRDLYKLLAIYETSRLRPPSRKQLEELGCGETHDWLAHEPYK